MMSLLHTLKPLDLSLTQAVIIEIININIYDQELTSMLCVH